MTTPTDHDDPTAALPGSGGPSSEELRLPARMGQYVLVELLGRGAMGRVYRADQLEPVRRVVAVKLLSTELVDADVLARFEAERQALALMSHPNIAQVFDAGTTSRGQPYFVMEYVPGENLVRYCDGHRLGLAERLRLLAKVVAAIRHAHQKGVIHRDIKPSNILVTDSDGGASPKVIDFGLAKAVAGHLADHSLQTHYGTLLGTPAYMSPEQAALSSEAVDTRSDIYALGLVLYELLTGKLPFGRMGDRRTTIEQMLRAIREDEPPRPSQEAARLGPDGLPPGIGPNAAKALRRDLDWIVLKCLAKQPDERYASAADLHADLERFLGGEPVLARRSTLGYVLAKGARRHRVPLAVGTTIVALSLVLGGGWLNSRAQSASRAEAAQRFGQSVERLDNLLRLSHTIPLHEVTSVREHLSDRAETLEEQLPRMDEWSRGPARYALGRVYLSLGRIQPALRQLKAAWQGGYRQPEVAYALGLAYGRLYRAGLEALEGQRDGERRRAREAELIHQYRDPAIDFLGRAGEGSDGASQYGDALIALYERRHEEARRLAEGALEKAPWLYEAVDLIGDAWREQGNERRDSGDFEAAMADYANARDAYAKAAGIGESDPATHARLCALAADQLRLHLYGPDSDVSGVFESGQAACDRALTALPGDHAALSNMARLLMLQGRVVEKQGGDPVPLYRKAADAGERSADAAPDSEAGLNTAGTAYQRLAEFESDSSGADPSEWLAKAGHAYERALGIAPENPDLYNELGNVHAIRGEHLEFYAGGNPMPDYRQAIDYYHQAIRRRPDSPYFFNNLGIAYADAAGYARTNGDDPVPWFDKAFDSYGRALEIKPDHVYALNNLGIAYVERARYAADRYESPMPWLDRAENSLDQAVRLKPGYHNGWHNLGRVFLNRVHALSGQGRDPTQAAQKALQAFNRANDIYASADTWLNVGNVNQDMGEWLRGRGRDPTARLDAAWDAYAEALALVPNHTHALENRWDVETERGYWAMANGGDPRPAARRAAAGLAEVAKRVPERYEPLEKRARALTLIAHYEVLKGMAAGDSLAAAADAFRQALALNANPLRLRVGAASVAMLEAEDALDRHRSAGPALERARKLLDDATGPDAAAPPLLRADIDLALLEARAKAVAGNSAAPDLERARRLYARLETRQPDHPATRRVAATLGYWSLMLGPADAPPESGESAIAAVDRLLDSNPRDGEAWALKAGILARLDRDADADEARGKALAINASLAHWPGSR